MKPSEVFVISGQMALPMWLLMIVLPKWKGTRFLIDYKIIPIALSIMYAIYIYTSVSSGGSLDFGSFQSVMQLFTQENAVLAGWVHYLAFDLLMGMWMLNQNKELGIHQLVMVPILLATFMLGPIGFLLFMTAKTIKEKLS
ncbi:MAG: DUF4281 domain-containing protein [Flavobacteriaceae bacterium]|nr:DUF4281 domain-containing protein [Flavobacteriaceae bacterium]